MLALNYHHLYYFWCVAREGHLTRAARQLKVSQSALSSQIRTLERSLGHELFVREARALRLSGVGHIVFEYADSIFSIGTSMIEALKAGEGQLAQTIRVGSVATLSRNFQESFLRPLARMSEVRLVLQSGSLTELADRLATYKLHLILSNYPLTERNHTRFKCRRIAQQEVCLIGPPRRTRRKFRFPEDLEHLSLLLPGYSTEIRTQFDLLCEELGLTVSIRAEVDDMALLRLLARNTDAVALAPAVVVKDELERKELETYCVVPEVFENFYAIYTTDHFQPQGLQRLLSEALVD